MAEQSYKGIMSGIGDIENNVNVIRPFFDARVRNFIIGQDGIIDGFKVDNGFINNGICVAQGYIGQYSGVPIPITSGNYIYGKFVIYNDDTILDEFYIVVADSEIVYDNDDILHGPGTFYLPLNDSKRLDYPQNAYHSDYTDTVLTGNIGIDKTNLQDGVTAVTQESNDNSKKVATTEFVQGLLKKYINADSYSNAFNTGSNTIFSTEISIRRRSQFVLLNININIIKQGSVGGTAQGTVFAQLPDGYFPKQEYTIGELKASGDYLTNTHGYIKVSTAGEIYLDSFVQSGNNSVSIYTLAIGWETE